MPATRGRGTVNRRNERVTVTDSKHGDELQFEVHDRERAREAFEHPFSYAAWRGLETSAADATALDRLAA